MNPFIQVIVVLFIILCFAGIGYALIYNFMASKNNEGLVTELNKQHKTDMNNVQKLANDVNTNDKLLADNYDTLKARIDANQIELLQFIDLKQDALLQSMNMDLVVQRLDQASADMLVQLVQREVAILKVIVQTQSTLLSKIQEVNNVTLDFVDSKFKETAASVTKNYQELTTFMSSYISNNKINIENITAAISQLNVVHHALEQQQMDLQRNMNSTNMNFSLLQADLQAKYTYLLDMIISDENSTETKLALLLTQTIWVDTATNFVGIGTKNPKDFLEIKQTGDTRFRVSGGTAGVNLCVATDRLTGSSSNCSSMASDNTGNISISSYDNNGNVYLQGAEVNQGGSGGNVLIGTRAIPKTISTPIAGSGANVKPMLYVNGPIVTASGIEFGATNQKMAAANAGLISYTGNSLDISGGGSNIDNRTLNFWADGGSFFKSKNGSAKVNMGELTATNGTFNGTVSSTGQASLSGGLVVDIGDALFKKNVNIGSVNNSLSASGNTLTVKANSLALNASDTTTTGNLIVNNTIAVQNTAGSKTATALSVNGAITATGDVTAFSDARLKSNVKKIDGALEKIKQMSGYTYNKSGDPKRSTGVIAQEVKAVLPEAVQEEEGGYMSVAYGNMAGVIIEAIKQLDAKIDALKNE